MEHKRGKILQSDARKIVYNVIKYFEEEKNLQRYHPYQYSNARAAMATGLSKNTITRIKKEGDLAVQQGTQIKTPTKGARGTKNTRVPVDNFTLVGIRAIISSIYDVRKEVPTLNKILAAAKKDLNFNGSKGTLRSILINKLGFQFKKCHNNRTLLLERSNIKAWRAKDWKKEVKHVKRLEDDYWTREVIKEREIEDSIIQVGLNSDSESDSEYESVEDDNKDDVLSGEEKMPLDDPCEGTSNM